MSMSWTGIGSTVTVEELTEHLRHAAQEMQSFAQLANPPTGEALGRGKGDTVQYTYYPNISVQGGRIAENSRMPSGSIVPVQGSYSLYEFGNSVAYTGKLADLARLPIEDGFVQALINDMHKAQNTEAFDQLAETDWIVNLSSSGDEFRTDGTAASFSNTSNEDLTFANLRYIVRKARANNIPYFDGESYVIVTGTKSADKLVYDTAVQDALRYDSGRSALNGEVGRVGKCRVVEDSHKITENSTETIFDDTFLVGADAMVSEYAVAPEVRAQDDDFGRTIECAWYFIAGWKKIYSQALHSREHVIRAVVKP